MCCVTPSAAGNVCPVWSPREIERIIGRHKDIKSVAVVGAPDARQGEIPVAFVVLRPEAVGRTTPDDLTQWFKGHMSGY